MPPSDIVCIVEPLKLCGEIVDNEISLPNYSSVRLDRSRSRHGGGILMYIKDGIPFSIVASGRRFRDYFCICFVV